MIPLTLTLTLIAGGLGACGLGVLPRQQFLQRNTSVLPPGWADSQGFDCMSSCFTTLPSDQFLFGPSFTDPVGLTIESCVAFCNKLGSRLAGLQGTQCTCSNIFNPTSCFESDDGCTTAGFADTCPGNHAESCGLANGSPSLYFIFLNFNSQFKCAIPIWQGGAALTAGAYHFSFFYNDSTAARALSQNAVDLPVPVSPGNMSTAACTTACGNAGFALAGVEAGNECYCGNAIENNAQPIQDDCSFLPSGPDQDPVTALMRCTGNPKEFCGGPNIISIYTVGGGGLVPLIPFIPELGDFCAGIDCPGHV